MNHSKNRMDRAALARGVASLAWVMAVGSAGCTGAAPGNGRQGRPGLSTAPGNAGNAGSVGNGSPAITTGIPAIPLDPGNPTNPPLTGAPESLAPTTRVARLSHAEWQNSVRDLFGLDATSTFGQDFRRDPANAGFLFDNNSLSLEVDSTLWQAYQRAAGQVAEFVVANPALLARISPPMNSDVQARARQFVVDFGERAYRRPLTSTEVDTYVRLFNGGKGLYDTLPDFESGVRLTIEGVLQSPHFLYRVELSAAKQGNLIPLNAFEIATRLSYALWNSTPDAGLYANAKAGTLNTAGAISTEATRLLDAPAARPVFVGFNTEVLDVARYQLINPSPTKYPNVGIGLAKSAQKELELFLDNTFFSQNGGFSRLFTSNDTFVNSQLASIYGLRGAFTQDFSPVTLPASERHGVLTQVGFLASHANMVDPDPIHRGVFLANHILCQNIAAPPGVIPPLPPPGIRTNRQRVIDHTEQPGSVCAACHGTIINPLGFPFENYDSVGAYRTVDNGMPVDASSSLQLDGVAVSVKNAGELSEALAKSAAAHRCYAGHLLEFTLGRPQHVNDGGTVDRLAKASIGSDLSLKTLISSLVTSQVFLNRSGDELP